MVRLVYHVDMMTSLPGSYDQFKVTETYLVQDFGDMAMSFSRLLGSTVVLEKHSK
jgi:hypothetical protein